MARKKYKKPVPISLKVENELRVHVQRQAARLTLAEGKIVTVNEAVLRAILTVYPLPKQEMFQFNT